MSQEARGLDAGPRLADRLRGLGDNRTAKIVRRIAEEERAHVAIGVLWFKGVRAALAVRAPCAVCGWCHGCWPSCRTMQCTHEASAQQRSAPHIPVHVPVHAKLFLR
jgi:uncharacterized ferredoxin-like protein